MLHDLKELKALAVAEMRGMIQKAETEKRNLTADENKQFDVLKAKITDLEAQETRASFLAEAERRMVGTPVDKSQATLESRVTLQEVLQAGLEGRAITGAAAECSKEIERRTGRKAGGVFVPLSVLEKRVNDTTSGAEVIGTVNRADLYIEPFRNKLLARKLGARVITGLTGDVTIPAWGSGVSSAWIAENSALSPSGMTFASKTLTPKHAGSLAEMSRQLIQQSSPGIEQLLRDDMAYALAKSIDSAMVKGGGANEPTGIMATANVQTANLATLTWLTVLAMLEKLELVNGDPTAWLASPGAATKLRGVLKSATAGAAYLAENGKMADLPVYSTNQVANATNSPDTGVVILGDFSQVILGVWSELDILVNPYAETPYTKGAVYVRAMATVDIAIRHPEAFVVASDVTL